MAQQKDEMLDPSSLSSQPFGFTAAAGRATITCLPSPSRVSSLPDGRRERLLEQSGPAFLSIPGELPAWLVYIEASICKSWIMFSSWALALSRWASVA
jgi:hypothetical protein